MLRTPAASAVSSLLTRQSAAFLPKPQTTLQCLSRTSAPRPKLVNQSPAQKTTARPIATMSATPLLELIKARRSYYPLSKDLPISKERISEIVKEATLHVPSSFNAQPTRVVVLFGAEHEKLWDITIEVLKGIVPEDSWKATGDKLNMFKASGGSVLFFDDEETVKGQQTAFPLYSDRFQPWATQANGMLQHTVWVALEAEGLGANLQHYNPLIDQKVAAQWGLPASWKLNAQLVFGGKTGEAGEKSFIPVDDRVKVFGA
ncbi:hypothetical protein JX266_004881 [Neoarthrinium moseri]|uniref:uncharacterized protein n=1 Tax=Neoarthrinium moseri TaxID=1658444 RepID=UPI001FDBCF1D|nr:uncharacterized protein JN550_011017 [Neoarthrinium moseri]KAI1849386.1 hypothetical protein JX266_004881 [Neoarthrinium moseri]KAI1861195.1 hypothetical protein JN550_011017 [Neoarthrinium moseri]